jgi:hypothetical protein
MTGLQAPPPAAHRGPDTFEERWELWLAKGRVHEASTRFWSRLTLAALVASVGALALWGVTGV